MSDLDDNIRVTRSPTLQTQRIGRATRPDTVALIGFLAAKLACHDPDDSAVQWALEWLNARK